MLSLENSPDAHSVSRKWKSIILTTPLEKGGSWPNHPFYFFSSVIEGLFVGNLTEGLHYLFIVPPSIFGIDARWLNPQLPLSSSEDSSSFLDFLRFLRWIRTVLFFRM